MDTLSRARDFLAANGRDVERTAVERCFGRLSLDVFVGVLGGYQNDDGGFGHGLEVDIGASASNPFATELALRLFLQCAVPTDHPVVQRTIRYLESTQDEAGDWRFTPEVQAGELAPWFREWQWPSLNPACTTAGLLRDLGLGSARLHERVERLFQRLKKSKDVANGSFYDVRPYAMYFLPEWTHPERELWISGVLWWHVRQHVLGTVADNGHFFEYVRGPETYIGRNLPRDILDERLAGLIAEQSADGGWPSPYSPKWRGWVTVQNLLVLKAFGQV